MREIRLTEDELDNLLLLRERMVKRQIDAAACGTSWDFQKMYKAEELYQAEYERLTTRK